MVDNGNGAQRADQVDAVLDGLDDILEDDAQAFVDGFVQVGGQ